MLTAGAKRVLWVRTRQGQLLEAMPRIRKEIAAAANLLLESNSVLRFLKPDLAIAVLDDTFTDFKPSALRYLDRVDLLLTPDGRLPRADAWPGVSPALLSTKPVYALAQTLPDQVERAVRDACGAPRLATP